MMKTAAVGLVMTASHLPFLALLGFVSIVTAWGLRGLGRRVAVTAT